MTRGYEIWRVLTNTHPGGGGPRTGESARTPSAVDMLGKYVKRMNGGQCSGPGFPVPWTEFLTPRNIL